METEHLNRGEWKDLEAKTDRRDRAEFDSKPLRRSLPKKQFSNCSAFQESDILRNADENYICHTHTHEGNLCHPLGQHRYGRSTAG